MSENLDVRWLLASGWSYRDIPWVRPAMFSLFIEGFGEGNYHILATSMRLKHENGPAEWQRGQVIISPTGRENLAAFYAANKDRFNAIIDAEKPHA